MKMTLSAEWNPQLKTHTFLDMNMISEHHLIGKCNGELFSINGDARIIKNILIIARKTILFKSLVQKMDLPPLELKPLIEELINGQLLTVMDNSSTSKAAQPYIGSVILTGGKVFVTEVQRALESLEFGLPVISLGQLSFNGDNIFKTIEMLIRSSNLPLLAGAPTEASLANLLAINTLCLETDTPWLPFQYDGAAARLGPMVIPYKTPCFGCMTVRLASEKKTLFPQFDQNKAYSFVQDNWPLPEKGKHALDAMRLIPDCVRDILALSTGGGLPFLIGVQKRVSPFKGRSNIIENLTVEAQSECPCCYCGSNAKPNTFKGSFPSDYPDTPIVNSIMGGENKVLHHDGGLRSMDKDHARKKITYAFAEFGTTFEIKRCGYGPLGDLPSYRSHSTGYISRDLPFLIPEKLHTGKGISEEQAFLSAAYEMAERVSASYHGQISLIQAKPSEVRDCALDIHQYIGTQYLSLPGLDRPEDDIKIDWVWAKSLISDRSILVPASFVFFPMVRFKGVYRPQWSGGLAAGAELKDAILQGLMERIEHDAWAIWQLNRIACPRIDTSTILDDEVQNWLEHVRGKGFDIIIRDKRTELGIPTFRVWIVNDELPRIFAARGDGANPDPVIALKRALTEAQHKLAVEDENAWQQLLTRPSVQLFDDELSLNHLSGLALFELEENGNLMDFTKIPNHTSNDVKKDIQNTVKLITTHIPDAEIAVVNLTDPILDIPVVRVMSSGLQEMAKPWTHIIPRTFSLPVTFGHYNKPLTYAQLYNGPFPH